MFDLFGFNIHKYMAIDMEILYVVKLTHMIAIVHFLNTVIVLYVKFLQENIKSLK